MYSMPSHSRRGRHNWVVPIVLLLVIALVIVLPAIARFTTDLLWFREVGRTDVFWTFFWGPWTLGALAALVFFALAFGNVSFALRRTSDYQWETLRRRLHERALEVVARTLRRAVLWIGAAIALFIALGVGRSAAGAWPRVLLFLNGQATGSADPVFHRDLSFYLFRLPIWESVAGFLFGALLFTLILTTVAYAVTGVIRTVRGVPVFAPEALRHLSLLLALLLLVKAGQYLLGRYSVMYAMSGGFVGPDYVDMHARIPGLVIMAVVAAIAAVLVVIGGIRRNILLPVAGVAGIIISSMLVLGIYPALVQRFRVDPNKLAVERPYLARHITATRKAYGLDRVREVPFIPEGRVTSVAANASPLTVNNIRLWDYRPLLQVYSQRQDLRTYYDIANIDIDRYRINGQMRQVMLAARELETNNIPDPAWDKQHFMYTHGYGLVMSPVNEVEEEKGEPTFFVRDLPPRSSVPELNVTRPEIYFGEKPSDYIVVNGNAKELDYASDSGNIYRTYDGAAGIPLKSPLVRAMMAVRFNTLNLLISNYITPHSRLIFKRQITERVQAQAPFLLFDQDPYLVVGTDGKLYWMLDAYTASTRYPYARYSSLTTAGGNDVSLNYLRNPVKVVVDAYNGSTAFYLADEQEPIIRAWRRAFPRMFQPLSAMPAGLREHVRVPEGMFNTLSEVYRQYHMTDAGTFYQQEDLWDIPQTSSDLTLNSESTNMEAYYIAMSLPGANEQEYLLIRPYTPRGKKNMISWLSARNDPAHFGELLVYNFPKQSLVFGPEQLQARINQDPEISSAVSLWNRSGSQVLWGNLLVIPLGKTILYVQPVYLQAERSQIPELQRVIVADQQRVVMRNTLDEALTALTGGQVATSPTPVPTPGPTTPPISTSASQSPADRERVRAALDHFRKGEAAVQRGDWATYGKEMQAVKRELEALNREG